MKGKFFKVLAMCLILLFTATNAYAKPGNGAAKGASKGSHISAKVKNNKHGGDTKKQNRGQDRDEDHGYVPVSGITLNQDSTTLHVNSWERLAASVQPANATDKKFYWFSSNPMVLSVNPSGKITGLAPGNAIIYVATRDGFKTDSCLVTVDGSMRAQVRIAGVYLNTSAMTLDTGDRRQLSATVMPQNASNKGLIWQSSNSAVAAVDQNGYVLGVDEGTAVITVRTDDGGRTAACTVTVRHSTYIHVSAVSIVRSVSSIAIKEGAGKRLNIELLPENATDKEVVWQTGNADIVSIDQNGYITGVREGTATIIVRSVDGSKYDSITVRVIPVDEWVGVSGISLNLINTTLPAGFADTLRYEIGPSNASDQDVRWSSSNPAVAAVNSSGRIEAKAAGTAVISAAAVDGGKTASCLVMVTPGIVLPAHGILFNKTASTLLVGEFDYPAVGFYPAGDDDYDLTWTSSDTGVAAVDQNGRVIAKGQGTAVITVKTSNNWSDSYIVMVTE